MVRANIKNPDEVYIGLIDEVDGGFRIVWNWNMENYPEYDCSGSEGLFQTFEEACKNVHNVVHNAEISETIYFKK